MHPTRTKDTDTQRCVEKGVLRGALLVEMLLKSDWARSEEREEEVPER